LIAAQQDLLESHPDGIAQRYIQEGRLIIREVARSLEDHDELGTDAKQILAETEGKRAQKPSPKPAHKANGSGAAPSDPDPALDPEPKPAPEMPSLEAMREELLEFGFLEEEIAKWSPEEMWRRIRQYREPDDFPGDDGGEWDEDEDQEEDEDNEPRAPKPKSAPAKEQLVVINAGRCLTLPPPRRWVTRVSILPQNGVVFSRTGGCRKDQFAVGTIHCAGDWPGDHRAEGSHPMPGIDALTRR
jgi:hypothetical protein